MKTMLKISVLASTLGLMVIADVPPELPSPDVQLVREAHAILGVRRRSAAVGYVAGESHAAAQQQAAAAQQQQAAVAQQQQATAQQQTATQSPPAAAAAPPPAATGKPLPLGTVVSSLPPGCAPTQVGGVEYHSCGGNFYRAAFQGSNLVYVTAKP